MKHLLIGLLALVPLWLSGCDLASTSETASPTNTPGFALQHVTFVPTLPERVPTATHVPPSAAATPLAAAPTSTAVPAAVRIGDVSRKEGMWLVVTRVQDPAAPGQFSRIFAGNKLVTIEAVIGNDGDVPITISFFDASLIDDSGFVTKAEPFSSDSARGMAQLQPGDRARGEIAFQVPKAAIPAILRLRSVVGAFGTIEAGLLPAAAAQAPVLPARVAPVLPKVGETVERNGYTLSVATFESASKPLGFGIRRPGNKLVGVELIVGNNNANRLMVNPGSAELVDTGGFVYRFSLAGQYGKQLDVGEIGSGEKVRGWIAFEIPSDATVWAIRMPLGSPFGSEYLYAGVSR